MPGAGHRGGQQECAGDAGETVGHPVVVPGVPDEEHPAGLLNRSTDTDGSSSSSCLTAARSRATCADIPTRATVPATRCCRHLRPAAAQRGADRGGLSGLTGSFPRAI